jgi:hypothetical protein
MLRRCETYASARVEVVRKLLGAPTTKWVLKGASPAGLTSNKQLDVADFVAGDTGEKLSAPSERSNSRPATITTLVYV